MFFPCIPLFCCLYCVGMFLLIQHFTCFLNLSACCFFKCARRSLNSLSVNVSAFASSAKSLQFARSLRPWGIVHHKVAAWYKNPLLLPLFTGIVARFLPSLLVPDLLPVFCINNSLTCSEELYAIILKASIKMW